MFLKKIDVFLDTLILLIVFLIIKLKYCQGDLTDTSAETKSLPNPKVVMYQDPFRDDGPEEFQVMKVLKDKIQYSWDAFLLYTFCCLVTICSFRGFLAMCLPS